MSNFKLACKTPSQPAAKREKSTVTIKGHITKKDSKNRRKNAGKGEIDIELMPQQGYATTGKQSKNAETPIRSFMPFLQ